MVVGDELEEEKGEDWDVKNKKETKMRFRKKKLSASQPH